MSLLHTLLRLFCGCLPGGWRRQRSERSTPAGNPLPKLVHKVLQPSEIGPGRVIIVSARVWAALHPCLPDTRCRRWCYTPTLFPRCVSHAHSRVNPHCHIPQVGDVHGCYDALLALLHRVKYQPRHDNLLLVGDLVGKGPKSQQVVCLCERA